MKAYQINKHLVKPTIFHVLCLALWVMDENDKVYALKELMVFYISLSSQKGVVANSVQLGIWSFF